MKDSPEASKLSMLDFWQFVRTHPRIASVVGVIMTFITAYGGLEAVWATVSEKPLVPVIGDVAVPILDEAARAGLILFLLVLTVVLFRTHLQVVKVSSRLDFNIPEYAVRIANPGYMIGSDIDIALNLNIGTPPVDLQTAKSVTLSMRQGTRTIIRHKPASVSEPQMAKLFISASESRKLIPGEVVLEITVVDAGGKTTVMPPFVMAMQGSTIR